jgi:hypothetical protein
MIGGMAIPVCIPAAALNVSLLIVKGGGGVVGEVV